MSDAVSFLQTEEQVELLPAHIRDQQQVELLPARTTLQGGLPGLLDDLIAVLPEAAV